MKLRFITVLVAIIACLGMQTEYSLNGSKGFLYAQEGKNLGVDQFVNRPVATDALRNYDQDFLKKDSIAPSKTGFIDSLFLPARKSALADKGIMNGITTAGKRIVAVGARGHIVYSDNGGKSWIQAEVPVSVDLTAVYFANAKQGWSVGHDGVVLHSSDGGRTWMKQLDGYGVCRIMNRYYQEHTLSGKLDKDTANKMRNDIQFMIDQGPVNPFLDVWFENDSEGFVVGAFNLLFHTENGGRSWEPWFDRTDNPMGMHLYAISPISKDIYISGEQGLMLKLDRKAKYFKSVKTPYMGTYFGVMGNSSAILAFGMRGNIFRSANEGGSWQKIETPEKTALLGGTVGNDGSFILVSQAGNVLISKDGGKSFHLIDRESGMGIPLHSVSPMGDNTVALASWLGVQVQKIVQTGK